MKNNPIRLLFAWDIPAKVCFTFPIIAPFYAVWFAIKPLENLKEPIFIGAAILILLLGIPLAFLLTVLFISIFIAPFYILNEKMNGGPFEVGDSVYILSGKHKGKVTEVYAKDQGSCVRIRLSDREKEKSKDVYPPQRLLNTKKLNQAR